MDKLRNRINELARKSKTVGLNKEEKEEQKDLREEYIQIFRSSFKNTLLNTTLIDPLGNDVTPDKLKKEQNKNSN